MKTLMTLAALVALTATSAFAADVPTGKYDLDVAHSKVGFEISHLVISTVEGRFATFTGTVDVKEKNNISINADIDPASIDTGNKDRDNHLKSPDFFDVAKFPKMTFKSKSVKINGGDATVVGDLTMHGVTKEVTLTGKYMGSAKDPWGAEKIVFQVSSKVKRSDYGLKWNKAIEAGPVVGGEVTISIKVEANKQKAEAKKK